MHALDKVADNASASATAVAAQDASAGKKIKVAGTSRIFDHKILCNIGIPSHA